MILIITYVMPSGQVAGVNLQFELTTEQCEEYARAHHGKPHLGWMQIARCAETLPPEEQLFAPVGDA